MAEKKTVSDKPAKVVITMPKNCKKTALSINALDSYTRELANGTEIKVGAKRLFCNSFRLTDKGTLLLEVRSECFELKHVVAGESVKV